MDTSQPIVIRRAAPADVEHIVAITDAAYAKYVPLLGRKPQPMSADYHHMVVAHPIWLLCVGDRPAGVLVLMFTMALGTVVGPLSNTLGAKKLRALFASPPPPIPPRARARACAARAAPSRSSTTTPSRRRGFA